MSAGPALSRLHVEGDRFVDGDGRQVLLRGVNLGGDSKVPFPNGGTQHFSDFSDHREVSFIGRPFPLDEANDHLGRIRHWGFNCLRLLTTWEAVEHAGPGLYDTDYLDYFEAICRKAGEHGLYVFIDFHQDVWSRMSGGDGAPGWTFEAVGLDFTRFNVGNGAHVMQHRFDYANTSGRQDAYPQMSWSRNYRMPANGIMWTLFGAGRTVTPDFLIDGVNVQDYLQGHLLAAMGAVAQRVKNMTHVVGFDSLNEPGVGWLGQPLSPVVVDGAVVPQGLVLPGPLWSPLECLAVAAGLSTSLAVLTRDPDTGARSTEQRIQVNAQSVSLWRDSIRCPFQLAGIYRIIHGKVVALKENVFQQIEDGAFNISEHAFGPFFRRVAQTIRQHQPHWLLFAEIDPVGAFTGRQFPTDMPPAWVNTSHWYDLSLLVQKSFDASQSVDLLTGEVARSADEVRTRYQRQLAKLKSLGSGDGNEVPTLVGEFGIPYDLDHGRAFDAWHQGQRTHEIWADHMQALGLMYDAMDALQLSSTQWNYTAGNRNDLRIGDQWNQEDLSIFSLDQRSGDVSPDAGGRAVAGFCRPYVRAVQGHMSRLHWTQETGVLHIEFTAQVSDLPTDIYLPKLCFPQGCDFDFSGRHVRYTYDADSQIAHVWAMSPGSLSMTITRHRNALPPV